MSLSLRSGYSRIPVVGEDIDDVIGVIYIKDIARRAFEHHEAEQSERVESLMRPAFFAPDSRRADELLRDMQQNRTHLCWRSPCIKAKSKNRRVTFLKNQQK